MATEAAGWVAMEFEGMDLGDERLNRRAVKLTEKLAAKPMSSIPSACGGWSETAAAYRFLSQEEMSWQDIVQPHWQRTQERMAAHEVVLCVQDTTELDFNGQEIAGLGPLSY
ncbi:transposase, IS4 family [Azoarcus sp. CIB]|nr:transposase, IS4 family [Azoarcus sp. CIB]